MESNVEKVKEVGATQRAACPGGAAYENFIYVEGFTELNLERS